MQTTTAIKAGPGPPILFGGSSCRQYWLAGSLRHWRGYAWWGMAQLYLRHSRSRTHGSTCYEISAKFANEKPRDIARGFALIEETRQPTSCALPSLCVLRYFPNGLLLPLASST